MTLPTVFDDMRLPSVGLESGAKGSASRWSTSVFVGTTGVAQRVPNFLQPAGRWDISFPPQDPRGASDIQTVLAMHYVCMGRAIGFRFKDWSDYQDDGRGVIHSFDGGSTYHLAKTYTVGSNVFYRKITRPLSVTLSAGSAASAGGLVSGATSGTWTGTFDVPVCFEDDGPLPISIEHYFQGSIQSFGIEAVIE